MPQIILPIATPSRPATRCLLNTVQSVANINTDQRSDHTFNTMTFEQAEYQPTPSRAALKLMEVYKASSWLVDRGDAVILNANASNQERNKAVLFDLLLRHDALPIVLKDLHDLQIGAYHNIDQEDVPSVLNFQGRLFLGSISLSTTCENSVATFESAALR